MSALIETTCRVCGEVMWVLNPSELGQPKHADCHDPERCRCGVLRGLHADSLLHHDYGHCFAPDADDGRDEGQKRAEELGKGEA